MSMTICIGKVISTFDDSDGLRIKARVVQDKQESTVFAFPLLPKTFQMVPKKDEAVLIFFAQLDNKQSQRYYIGPIIPQPQYMEYAEHDFALGSVATMLLDGSVYKPKTKLSNYPETDGAFPNKEDVALVGRHSEDIILKKNEINLRCGIRTKPPTNDNNDQNDGLFGDVVFNGQNPAYIQMKYRSQGSSVINMVSDKVNILSHGKATKSPFTIPLLNSSSTNEKNTEHLIKESTLDLLMEQLHPLPYGDKIVKALEIIMHVIENHTHSFPGVAPSPYSTLMLSLVRSMDMVNPDIRIN